MVCHPPCHQQHQQAEQGKSGQHGQGGLQQQPVEQVVVSRPIRARSPLPAAEFRGGQPPSRRSSLPGQQGFGAGSAPDQRLPPAKPLFIDPARRCLFRGMQMRRRHRQAHEPLFRPAFPGLDHGVHIGHGVAEIGHLCLFALAPAALARRIKPVGSGLSGASPIAIRGGSWSPRRCCSTKRAEGGSAPLTNPQRSLRFDSVAKKLASTRRGSSPMNPVHWLGSPSGSPPK